MNDLLTFYYFTHIKIINKCDMLCSHLFLLLNENETENNLLKLRRFCSDCVVFTHIA